MTLITACTTFEDSPKELSLSVEDLNYSSSAEVKTVTIVTTEKWDITEIPKWIKVETIDGANFRNYEWTIHLAAYANDSYDRTGTIKIQSKSYQQSIAVFQAGEKGPYKEVVSVTGVELNKTTLALTVGDSETLEATIRPSDATNKSLTWASGNNSIASVNNTGLVTAIGVGTTTITVKTEDGGKTDQCLITVAAATTGFLNGHEWVDLGMPSGLKWATCNIGASSSEEAGNYYAWGEVTPKSDYSWTNYKFRTSGESKDDVKVSKYNTVSYYGVVDNKTTLEMPDDAARVNWGGEWRMPTTAEFYELKNQCTCTWTSQDGKKGYKVTSITNGNSIFLPVTGYRNGTTLFDDESFGYYWSSMLNTSNTRDAWSLRFYWDSLTDHFSFDRNYGLPVRPVWSDHPVVPVEKIELDCNSLTLTEGEKATIIATVKPDNATYKSFTWSSDNSGVASVSDGVVTATAPGMATITVTTVDGLHTATCLVTVNAKPVAVTGINLNKSTLKLVVKESETLIATVEPENAANKTVTWKTEDETIATVNNNGKVTGVNRGSVKITVTTDDGGYTASCIVTVTRPSSGKVNGHLWVDMGLSVMWATCNLGASAPEDYGYSYTWGDITARSSCYGWESCRFWTGGSMAEDVRFSKYNTDYLHGTVDNKTTLEKADDAASINWGGTWRLPTIAEWEELKSQCIWSWTTQGGRRGCKVTSPITGNSIFLPAAGFIFTSTRMLGGEYGYYWSSSLNAQKPYYARDLYFSSSSVMISNEFRYQASSIRAVTEY